MAVQCLGRRSTQLLARDCHRRHWTASYTRPGRGDCASSGPGEEENLGGAGDPAWLREPDRVQPEGFVGVLQRRGSPGCGLGDWRAPQSPPAGGAVLWDPRPSGETHLYRAPGSGVMGDRLRAKGFRAHCSADGGCLGPKVNLPWPRPRGRLPQFVQQSCAARIRTDSVEVFQRCLPRL